MVRKNKFDFIANEVTPAIRMRAEKGIADTVQQIVEDHGLAKLEINNDVGPFMAGDTFTAHDLNALFNRITRLEHEVRTHYHQVLR